MLQNYEKVQRWDDFRGCFRFKDIANSAITLQYTSFVLKEKGIF